MKPYKVDYNTGLVLDAKAETTSQTNEGTHMGHEYFIVESDEPKGPYSASQLFDLLKCGEISPETLFCKSGDEQWVPLRSIPGLAETMFPMLLLPVRIDGSDSKGLIKGLFANRQETKSREQNFRQFRLEIDEALRDGNLSDDDALNLPRRGKALDISFQDYNKIKVELFQGAIARAKLRSNCSLSKSDESELEKIRAFLNVKPHEVPPGIYADICRNRILHDLRAGAQLTPILIEHLVLLNGETALWQEAAVMYEERVVGTKYEGSSSGVTFEILEGVDYTVGGSSGRLVNETAVIPVSSGPLVVTNQRLLFLGDKESFATAFESIISLKWTMGGLVISESNGNRKLVKLLVGENSLVVQEVVKTVLKK